MMENKINKKRDLFIIVGGSRLGANLASIMSRHQKDVILIDVDSKAFLKLNPDYSGYTIEGDAADINVLEKAGIDRTFVLIAATNDDNTNLMISQMAKVIFHVPHVIARMYSTDIEEIASENNVHVIYPYKLSIDVIEKYLKERGCV